MMSGMRMGVSGLLVAVLVVAWTAPVAAQAPRSWTTDRRHFEVGDVISVLLDEYTLASANRNDVAEEQRTGSLEGSVSYDGTTLGRAGLETDRGARSRDRGERVRRDRLAGEITVRVVEVDERGLLRVEGTKRVTVDEHEQEMKLTGWVRPEDVPAHNVMESWRIADATIEYTSTGDLGKPTKGLISRILGWIWP
jgi:flagellar L-ring protein precursor FlgH